MGHHPMMRSTLFYQIFTHPVPNFILQRRERERRPPMKHTVTDNTGDIYINSRQRVTWLGRRYWKFKVTSRHRTETPWTSRWKYASSFLRDKILNLEGQVALGGWWPSDVGINSPSTKGFGHLWWPGGHGQRFYWNHTKPLRTLQDLWDETTAPINCISLTAWRSA